MLAAACPLPCWVWAQCSHLQPSKWHAHAVYRWGDIPFQRMFLWCLRTPWSTDTQARLDWTGVSDCLGGCGLKATWTY